MEEITTQDESARCEVSTPRSRRMEVRLAVTTFAWAFTFVTATFLIKGEHVAGLAAWTIALLPTVAAVFVLTGFVRFLRAADELQRLIQLQALGLATGGGFFVICGYSLFEALGAPETSGVDLATAMPLLYALGVLLGSRRYR